MNALISGSAGVALIVEGDSLMSLDVAHPGEMVSRSLSDWNLLFGHAKDIQFLEDTNLDTLSHELQQASNYAAALDLSLIILDPELSEAVRKEAAGELNELLTPSLRQKLEFILYACPLPASADLQGAKKCCEEQSALITYFLFENLEESQPAIRDIYLAWNAVSSSTFVKDQDRGIFQQRAIETGLFYLFAIKYIEDVDIEDIFAPAKHIPTIQAFPNYEQVLAKWAAMLQQIGKREITDQITREHGNPAMFSHIAIDFGTTNMRVYSGERGILISEPSIVAINKVTNKVEAVGNEAKEMLGRTPGHIIAIQPMNDGIITNFEMTERLLQHLIHQAHPKSIRVSNNVIISVPSRMTQVERRAVEDAAYRAKASKVYLVAEEMAAAIGAGLLITEPYGNMIVDIGGGMTYIAVISSSEIVYSRVFRVAGNEFDEAIIQFIKRKYNLLIGERTAESIKIEMGSAWPVGEPIQMEIKGRNLIEGVPRTITITDEEVREALANPISTIVNAVRVALERTPPELSADIAERGIVLTGGGALLKGIDKRLMHETGVPVSLAKTPLLSTVLGIGKILTDLNLFRLTTPLLIDRPSRFT